MPHIEEFTGRIESAEEHTTKGGRRLVKFVLTEVETVNGQDYELPYPLTFFPKDRQTAPTRGAMATVKARLQSREWNGKVFLDLVVLAFSESTAPATPPQAKEYTAEMPF